MRQRQRSNVMILELIIVILFFSLATAITTQVFVKAHERSKQSVRTTDAMVKAEDWLERLYASDRPEEMLLGNGWKNEAEGYGFKDLDGRMSFVITLERTPTGAGEMLRIEIEAYDDVPLTRPLLVSLPCERYVGGAEDVP